MSLLIVLCLIKFYKVIHSYMKEKVMWLC